MLNLLLLFLVYEDFKFRAISVIPLLMLLIASVLYSSCFIGLIEIFKNSALIFLFLLVQYILLKIYFLVRRGDNVIVNRRLGLGDLVFFIAIVPLFSPIQFMVIYIAGLIFVLLVHLITRKNSVDTIPLAGSFSIYLTLILLFGIVTPFSLCSDDKLISIIDKAI
jgi:hypothetical protein